jgi:hypothetical protein
LRDDLEEDEKSIPKIVEAVVWVLHLSWRNDIPAKRRARPFIDTVVEILELRISEHGILNIACLEPAIEKVESKDGERDQ